MEVDQSNEQQRDVKGYIKLRTFNINDSLEIQIELLQNNNDTKNSSTNTKKKPKTHWCTGNTTNSNTSDSKLPN